MSLWDVVGDAADAVAAPFVWVAENVPGVSHVVQGAGELVADFAKSDAGRVVLRAMATSMTGGLAAIVGPQLATVAWAVPGLLRGEPFDEAWTSEFSYRVEKTAEHFGGELGTAAAGLLGEQLARATAALASRLGEPGQRLVDMAAPQLAAWLDIREDVAQLAIDLWNRVRPDRAYLARHDPETGRAPRAAYGVDASWLTARTPSAAAREQARLTTQIVERRAGPSIQEILALTAGASSSAAPMAVRASPSPERAAPNPAPQDERTAPAILVLALIGAAALGAYVVVRRRGKGR